MKREGSRKRKIGETGKWDEKRKKKKWRKKTG